MLETDLDPLLHQSVRTRLAAYVAVRGEATFSELKKALETTDGNLEGHVKKLIGAGYLWADKAKGTGRPQTLYRLTSLGEGAFRDYMTSLQRLFYILSAEMSREDGVRLRSEMTWLTD